MVGVVIGGVLMKLASGIYNRITTNNEEIITFLDSIPGFNDIRRFIFLYSKENWPFIIMQSVENENLAFITINPWEVLDDYEFEISDLVKNKLEIESSEDILVLAICNLREKFKNMTANLVAPVVINFKKRLGKQVILDNTDYQIRHPVFSAQSKLGG